MASSPYARVIHLLKIDPLTLPHHMTYRPGWQKTPRTATPTTLTGNEQAISSYQLCIAYRKGDDWYVYDHKSTATTNRHLSAVRSVIESQGYNPTDELVDHNFSGRTSTYRKYVKEAS